MLVYVNFLSRHFYKGNFLIDKNKYGRYVQTPVGCTIEAEYLQFFFNRMISIGIRRIFLEEFRGLKYMYSN